MIAFHSALNQRRSTPRKLGKHFDLSGRSILVSCGALHLESCSGCPVQGEHKRRSFNDWTSTQIAHHPRASNNAEQHSELKMRLILIEFNQISGKLD